jgi:hypothetical protein
LKRKRIRVPAVALFVLVLVLWLVPAPSDTAPVSDHEFPLTLDEGLLRHDLAVWMSGTSEGRLRPPVSPEDLARALSGGQASPRPELFRRDRLVAQQVVLDQLPYGATLGSTCERNGIDPFLVAAVVEAESQFVADAVSPEGAVGLMQLLPSTATRYGVHNLFDPDSNVEAGSRYLRELLDRFGENPELALAAYNCGPEVVARYGKVPPYRETQSFVRKVMALYRGHQDHAHSIEVGEQGLFANRTLTRTRGSSA